MNTPKETWLFEIKPKNSLFNLNLKEVWQYRDLLLLFVKRDVVTVYKQTILGPLWYLIQPLFTSITFTLIFNNIANIETGVVPSFLFNLAGITVWNYFRDCLMATSDTFTRNASIFGKVYFPRIIMPMSIVVSNLMKFGIQIFIFILFYIVYIFKGAVISPNATIVLFPILVLFMGMLGLGLGMIISSMVTKYRDLKFLMSFAVQLLMYVSVVMYPLSLITQKISEGKIPKFVGNIITYNPMTQVIESARYMLLNEGSFSYTGFLYTGVVSSIVLLLGLLIFNKTEKSFIDTV
jgi:lipopolysaccharide transport system permease protein